MVSTTVANEVVPCFETAGLGYCIGTQMGDPLVGGTTLLSNGNTLLSKGKIVLAK